MVVTIPPKPRPPLGAAEGLTIPPVGIDGTRVTVNSNISTEQKIWNLRSAYNVAALNCLDTQYAPILAGYSQFLQTHSKALASVNKDLDRRFRENYGSKVYIRERETYQTQVYNYFALPPVKSAFCNAALQVSNELLTVPAGQLETYALNGLDKVDTPFREFFNSYDQYRSDLRAWESLYGAGPPVTVSVPAPTPAISLRDGT
ncbi:hypothetical protein B2G71_10020 [Novosphingobium sp. PC22D]|nr:hypothetical protein B2G71_10020 [Novosphingobium sp. PC22D]